MNENIDLTKILKDCPKGTKLYTPLAGEVYFVGIKEIFDYQIYVEDKDFLSLSFNQNGKYFEYEDGECLLFPSKEIRDWSNFKAPWYKKEKFDPKTLKVFDKVITRCLNNEIWRISYFSNIFKK